MLKNIKTRIFKFCDLSLDALTQIRKWLRPGFDLKILNNSQLQVAVASNAAGQAICYTTVETASVVGLLANNPDSTEVELRSAGNTIEAAIAHQAAQTGATTMLMVVPDHWPSVEGEEFIRIVRRKIQPAITQGLAEHSTPSVKFVN